MNLWFERRQGVPDDGLQGNIDILWFPVQTVTQNAKKNLPAPKNNNPGPW